MSDREVYLRTLDMTQQMYDYAFKYHIELDIDYFHECFVEIHTEKEWKELCNTPSRWKPWLHFYYVKKDSNNCTMNTTYLLSRDAVFGDCDVPDYAKELRPTYYYIWKWNAEENSSKSASDIKEDALTGAIAWKMVSSMIHRYYTDDEINEIIEKYGTDEECSIDKFTSLLWTNHGYKSNEIIELDDVYYFDINKAYASNLMMFFPKLKNWMLRRYKSNKPLMKKIVNYAVGCMNRMYPIEEAKNDDEIKKRWDVPFNFRRLRRAIVRNTSIQINNAMKSVNESEDSRIFYINTDGFFIQHPSQLLTTSKEIGDWGLEQIDNQKVWALRVKDKHYANYSILQYFEDGKKVIKSLGGFRQDKQVVDQMDLSNNQVVLFTQMKVYDNDDSALQIIDELEVIENYGK